ncbi:MAG: hypothetical protein KJ976_06710 [Proteobacteria bacterium]|nr:hypothetical protein [Pseudomonadota bacterium]
MKKSFLSILNQRKRIFYAGSLDIIKKYPVIGVLASGKAPGTVVWDTYRFFYSIRDEEVTFAGGWHSPLEKGILDALIEGKANVAFFPAKGLKNSGFKQKFIQFDKRSRGVMISPFPDEVTKVDRQKGPRLRNELLASTSDVLLIPYIKPNGMLARMLKTYRPFLNKTFILNHPENESFELTTQRANIDNPSDLLESAQKAFIKRTS